MSTELITKEILHLHKAGRSIRQIASALNVTKYTVERTLKNNSQTVSERVSENLIIVSEMLSDSVQTASELLFRQNQTMSEMSSSIDFGLESGLQQRNLEFHEEKNNDLVSERILMEYLYKVSLQDRYRDLLFRTNDFLISNFRSGEYSPELLKNRQKRIDDQIKYAKEVCSVCGKNYFELFIAYTLSSLYMYFERLPELLKQAPEFQIKEEASIRLLLKSAGTSDVFAVKQEYNAYFSNI